MVHRIPRDSIDIPPRQRTTRSPDDAARLADSILARGLLHPPVFRSVGERNVLVAGETRLLAIDIIASRAQYFTCDGETFLPGEVPALRSDGLSAAGFAQLELEENLLRSDLSWQDRVRALDSIHKMRLSENPDATIASTARELAALGGVAGGPDSPSGIAEALHVAAVLAPKLDEPEVARSRSATEAYRTISEREERAFAAESIRRTAPDSPDCTLRHGDPLALLPAEPPGLCDLVLADLPLSARDGSGAGVAVRSMIQGLLLEAFRLCKPRANLFLWLDVDQFLWAKLAASAAGWEPWRTPLIETAPTGACFDIPEPSWSAKGFSRQYYMILYCTKGQRGVLAHPPDLVRNSDRHYRRNERLIECSTLPGDRVLIPYCGRGTLVETALALRRRVLAIEPDRALFDQALVNTKR